jgi:hypothetical protein
MPLPANRLGRTHPSVDRRVQPRSKTNSTSLRVPSAPQNPRGTYPRSGFHCMLSQVESKAKHRLYSGRRMLRNASHGRQAVDSAGFWLHGAGTSRADIELVQTGPMSRSGWPCNPSGRIFNNPSSTTAPSNSTQFLATETRQAFKRHLPSFYGV